MADKQALMGSHTGPGLSVRPLVPHPAGKQRGGEGQRPGGLSLVVGELKAGHPERRTPGPFVHQTPQLLEGPSGCPPYFNAEREKGRGDRDPDRGCDTELGERRRECQETEQRGGDRKVGEGERKKQERGTEIRTRRARTEKATRKKMKEETGAERGEKRATGRNGHRGPSPSELLVGCL